MNVTLDPKAQALHNDTLYLVKELCPWYALAEPVIIQLLLVDALCPVQELGPWCAAAVLLELLRSKQVNNLMDPVGDIAADNRYTEEGPASAAITKTPGAYGPTPTAGDAAPGPTSQIKGTTPASQSTGKGQDAASQHQADTDMLGVFPVKKPAPVTPEVQALNVALREVAKMLTQALPLSKRRRLASAHGDIHVHSCFVLHRAASHFNVQVSQNS